MSGARWTDEDVRRINLGWRGIDDPEDACRECLGCGVKCYPTSATWRGGAGGMTLTNDVCDHCWGSGNRHKPWPSHRLLLARARGGS